LVVESQLRTFKVNPWIKSSLLAMVKLCIVIKRFLLHLIQYLECWYLFFRFWSKLWPVLQ